MDHNDTHDAGAQPATDEAAGTPEDSVIARATRIVEFLESRLGRPEAIEIPADVPRFEVR